MYFFGVFLFALLIRLVGITQSLWLDEAVTAKVVRMIPLFQIPVQFSPGDFHPPLYYMILSVWTRVFGYGEPSLRFPSILFSLITGYVIYLIARGRFSKKVGQYAVIFFLFNPLIVYYSQEARMYSLATLFTTCSLLFFFRLQKKYSLLNVFLFLLFSCLNLYTFYGTIFIVGILFIYFLKEIKNKKKSTTLLPLLFFFILTIPLLFLLKEQLINAHTALQQIKNWSLVLGKAELKNLGLIFVKFATGRISWYPKLSYYLLAGIPTAFIWIVILQGIKKDRFLALLFITPLLLALCISFFIPMMQYFRFIYLIPIISLLLAKITDTRIVLRNLTMGIFVVFSCIYLFNSGFYREDWKQLAAHIDTHVPVYMILPSSDPVIYYNSSVPLYELRDLDQINTPLHIQVIPYVEEIYGFDHKSLLEKKGCVKTKETTYRGPLLLEEWTCPMLFTRH